MDGTQLNVGAYKSIVGARGVPQVIFAFLTIGIASTMTPVVLVLFVRAATGSYATASLVVAASTTGGLIVGPLRGRLVDRRGARQAVMLLTVPDVLTDLAFIAAGHEHQPPGVLIGLGFLAGAVTAPAVVALRGVFSSLLDDEQRHAGFAVLTMMQETSWIGGPLIAGVIIALTTPAAAVLVSALLSFVGALIFITLHDEPVKAEAPRAPGRLPALAGGGIRTVVACATFFGLTFGVLDVAFPAFARQHGSAATAGVLLSAFAVGTWIGGFGYGLAPHKGPAAARYPMLCLLATAGLAPLILALNLPLLVALSALAGLCYAPITTCQLAVIDEVVHPAHKAESFTWLSTLYGAGLALGAVIAGQLITTAGVRLALATATASTLVAWLLSLAFRDTMRNPAPDQQAATTT